MTTRAAAAAAPADSAEAKKPVYAPASDPSFIEGRRKFFKYRELGATAASEGKVRAQVTIAKEGMTQPTGWHYHQCDVQFIYLLKGWLDLEFEGGEKFHMTPGDSLYIPGGVRHNETGTSDDFEILEISLPAEMGTVACDPPND